MGESRTQEEVDELFRAHLKSLTEAFEGGTVRAIGMACEIDVKEVPTASGIVEKHPGDNQTWTFRTERVKP